MALAEKAAVRTYSGRSSRLYWWGVVGICAALYGGALWATHGVVFIPGVTWFRPANILSEIFGACFGYAGAMGTALGNTLGDLLGGGFNPVTLWWVFPIEFVFTASIVYWGVTDPSLRSLRGKIEWAIFAVIGQGLLTGFGLSFFLCFVTNLAPAAAFRSIGWTISLNEGLPAIIGGLVQYALFPLIVKRGLWMGRNLDKSNVPVDYLAKLRR